MDWSDASALADLQMHWDEAYVIGLDGDIWSARYQTSTDELRAHTSGELRELIRSDYAYRQKVDRATRDPDEDADEEDGADEEDEADEEGLADGSADAGDTEIEAADGSAGADEIENEAGDRSAGAGGDAAAAARRMAADVNFAAIRGERMST